MKFKNLLLVGLIKNGKQRPRRNHLYDEPLGVVYGVWSALGPKFPIVQLGEEELLHFLPVELRHLRFRAENLHL